MISSYKTTDVQPLLWDQPLGNHGHARTVIGDLCERLTASLVGGRRHRTDSTADYCPDVSVKGEFFESKSVGTSDEAFVYGGRLEADRAFWLVGNRLTYVIWNHCANVQGVQTVAEIERLVLDKMRRVLVVPFAYVEACCVTPEPLNSNYGGHHDRPEYGSGYRIKLNRLDRFTALRFPHGIGERTREVWLGDSR